MYRIAISSIDENLMSSYRQQKKNINKNISDLNKVKNIPIINSSDNNIKAMAHSVVNNKLGRTKRQQTLNLKINDSIIQTDEQVRDAFAHHFANDVPNKIETHFRKMSTSCTNPEIVCNSVFVEPISGEGIVKIINAMKNKPSVGVDEIPIKLLKFCKRGNVRCIN